MRYLNKTIFIVVNLLASAVLADAVLTTRLLFKENVRQELRDESTYSLPDTAFNDFVNRALVWTSVDCGGVQSRVKIKTVANQAFYAMPDTVVEVLVQTLVTGDVTKSIKAMYPQFAEQLGVPTSLTDNSTDEDVVPTAWTFWDDTLQLIAVPEKVDSIWFYCHVEHPALASDTMAIRFRPAYTEAALYYCCMLILEAQEEYQDAAYYEARYEKTRAKLRALYQPKFDILQKQ